MAGGIVYTKTIDPSVQDGLDNNLIIQPNYAYQNKFEFGDDWNEIIIGMFYSYTYSETDNNKAYPIGSSTSTLIESSGATSNDTVTYLGAIRETTEKYLPNHSSIETDSTKSFIGTIYSNIYGDYRAQYNNKCTYDTITGNWQTRLVNNGYSYRLYSPSYSSTDVHPVCFTPDDATAFGNLFMLRLLINNKGQSNQTVLYEPIQYKYYITDISLQNLKIEINNFSGIGPETYSLNDGTTPAPLPDSFFFYNAFLTVRPRIHAVAVKKIS